MKQTKTPKSKKGTKKEITARRAVKTAGRKTVRAPKTAAKTTAPASRVPSPRRTKEPAKRAAHAKPDAGLPRKLRAGLPVPDKSVDAGLPLSKASTGARPVTTLRKVKAAKVQAPAPKAAVKHAPAAPKAPSKPAPAVAVSAAPANAVSAAPVPPPKPALPKLKLSSQATVRELAEKMGIKVNDFIKKLMTMGIFATINQRLDSDVSTLVADECGFELEIVPMYAEDELGSAEKDEEKPENLKARPPVVTIMGHVNHGKTRLLDAIRKSDICATEAGAITQHIGAYRVETHKGLIVILDTPGHEAFTAMRARGVRVTDIVVLVVSAVDSVMPQTIEAIDHAKAAGVPILVAINKIDLPQANPGKVKQDLANLGINPEEWGGKTLIVEISAKQNINIDKLLGIIRLQAEMMELKANPDKPGVGAILEARLDSKRGIVATVLISSGTVKVGDPFVTGTSYGKVKALINDHGVRMQSMGPSMPAEILGISGLTPQVGDSFNVVESERDGKHIAEKRRMARREDSFAHQRHVSLLGLKSQIQQKLLKELRIILKADVQGSIQAVRDSLEKISTQEVGVAIIHSGVGNINESDVLLAKASDTVIFGFHVDSEPRAVEEANRSGVEIRNYKIIYELLSDVKAAMSGLLEPEIIETVTGRAQLSQVFNLSFGKVAGCTVLDGKLTRNQTIRIMRDKKTVYTGKLSSIKRFKDDVREIEKGFECGLMFEGFKDYIPNDIVEAVIKETKARRIENV